MLAQDALEGARCLLQQGDKAGALQHMRAWTQRVGATVPAGLLFDWGSLHADCGDALGAEGAWQAAMAVVPIDPRAANNLGVLRLQNQDLLGAQSFVERALHASADFVPALINLGIIHATRGDLTAALVVFRRVLAREPDNIEALRNLMALHEDLGDRDAAASVLEQFLRLAPSDPDALYLGGVHSLRHGALPAGWRGYEHRWSRLGRPRQLKGVPLWSGEALDGKRLLVIDEQGIGEQITFAGCVPFLAEQGASVTLRCAPKLKRLFAASFPNLSVFGSGEDEVGLKKRGFDYQVALGSLPQHFWKSLDDLDIHERTLRPSAEQLEYWRGKVGGLGPGLKVGISWRGGSTQTGGALRSISLEQWRPLLQVPGVHFVNLQYTDCLAEVADAERRFGCRIHTWDDALGDYSETAALVSSVDLVVSVATALVRLCGAVGKEVWALVPVSADWIYQAAGNVTPWVPSAMLFRQDRAMQWEALLAHAALELRTRASAKPAGEG